MTLTRESVQLYVWYNLKSYLSHYGVCLLDELLCIQNENTEDPTLRYFDFTSEYSKHFDLLDYSSVRLSGSTWPFIGVYFVPRQKEKCEHKLLVGFQVEFHSPSPNCSFSCKVCKFTTQESLLCWKDAVINSLSNMFSETFADKMFCNDDVRLKDGSIGIWPYNLKFTSEEPFVTGIRRDEDNIQSFNIEFEITINGVYAAGYCTNNAQDCLLDC